MRSQSYRGGMIRRNDYPVWLASCLKPVDNGLYNKSVDIFNGFYFALYASLMPHLVRSLHMYISKIVSVLQKRIDRRLRLARVIRI